MTNATNPYGGSLDSGGNATTAATPIENSNILYVMGLMGAAWIRYQVEWSSIELAIQTTVATAISAGSRKVTPASMTGITTSIQLIIDQGLSTQETITPSATTSITFTATFAQSHSAGFTVTIVPLAGDNPTSAPTHVQPYNWSVVDDYLTQATAKGMSAVFVVQNAPTWHLSGAIAPNKPYLTPSDTNTFLQALTTRYNGSGANGAPAASFAAIELGNEGYDDIGSPANASDGQLVAQLLATCYSTIKTNNPSTLVGCAAMLQPNGNKPASHFTTWVDDFYGDNVQGLGTTNGKNYCDYMNFHFYNGNSSPDVAANGGANFTQMFQAVQSAMATHSDGSKPIWVTEVGWTLLKNTNGGVADSTLSGYIQTLLTEAMNSGYIQRLFYYDIGSLNPGVHNTSPTQSYNTYAAFITQYPTWTPASSAVLSVSPSTLNYNAPLTSDPSSETVTLSNTGSASGNWTSSIVYGGGYGGSGWLTLSSTSGTLAANANTSITVNATPVETGLAPGTYSATISFQSGASSASVAVTLTVASGIAYITASPASMTFVGQTGGSNPVSQAINIANPGNLSANWTASIAYTNGSGWLSLSATSGTLAATTGATLNASVSLSGLSAGSYQATITFSMNGYNTVVNVVFVVTASTTGGVRSVMVVISNVPTGWMEGTLKISNTLDQRSTCTFAVHDATGTNHYQPGQPVLVYDNSTGLLFTGYIDGSKEKNLYPQPDIISTLTCIDQHYLADKRVAQKDYLNRYAGDIATDLLHTYLAQEGVNLSNSANRSDQYQLDWSQGTLANLVAAQNVADVEGGGNLELAPSGSAASFAQQTQSDFSGASNLLVWNASLQGVTFEPTQAIKLSGTQGSGNIGNAYVYVKFWSGSLVIPSGTPTLSYDIWIPDSCPQQFAGIDLVFTDGSTLRDQALYPNNGAGIYTDAQGIGAHPDNDLSGLATNQWYHRDLPLYGPGSTLAGKTLAYATVAFEGDNSGNYISYFRNITLSGTILFSATAQSTQVPPEQLQTAGYSNVQCQVVTAYEVEGSMRSPVYTPSSAGVYNTSLLIWQETDATNCTVEVQCSTDGGHCFTTCTNNAPLPGFLAGQGLYGTQCVLRYQFNNTGNDPTQTPILSSVQAVINPSYACNKSDINLTFTASSDWTLDGTLTNLVAQNNTLGLNGVTRNWDDANYSSQTMYGSNGPGQSVYRKTLQLRLNNGNPNFAVSRFDFAGQWQNFTAEIDVNIASGVDEYGLVYRTTGWSNTNDTYAYSAYVSASQIVLGYGTNTGSGSGLFNLIKSVSISLSSGSWHRLKVVVNGTSHQIYLDNTLYINMTDTHYTAAGYIGARLYSPSSNYDTGQFDNFGVCASLSGQWVSGAINFSSLVSSTNNQILAQIDPSTNTSLSSILIEFSPDGTHFFTVFPGAGNNIPTMQPGQSLGFYTACKLRVTLSTTTASSQPLLDAITMDVLGFFYASGSRIAPASSLAGMNQAGSTAITWKGLVPPNTSCTIDSSLDGINFTNVATVIDSTPGNTQIAGINGQSDPTQDDFSTNSSANYSSTYEKNGSVGTWTWDTANTRLEASNGVNAVLLYQSILAQNIDILTVMDTSNSGGMVWCWSDNADFYELVIEDASSGKANPNSLTLNKLKSNIKTQLATAAISFTRGTPHQFEATTQLQTGGGALITVYMDNTTIFTYTDSTPLAGGQCGLYTNGGTAQFYQLRIQQLGDIVTAQAAYTRVNMSTYDPTASPQLTTLTLSAHAPIIGKGNLIAKTNQYAVSTGGTKSIAQCLDDLAKQSNYYWLIDKNKNFIFSHRAVTQAPRVVTNNEMLVGTVSVENVNTSYRNLQWIVGGVDVVADTQSFVGDGRKRTFTLAYPVYSMTNMLVNGAYQSVGVQGVDTGKQWYYQVGSRTITQDTSLFPLLKYQYLTINYNGSVPVAINQQSSSAISTRAALDGTSGIVEAVESAPQLISSSSTTLAQARLGEYATKGQILTYTTNKDGLATGQQASHFVAQHNIQGVPFLIQQLDLSYKTIMAGGVATLLPYYKIKAVSGAMLYDWTHFFAIMGQQ